MKRFLKYMLISFVVNERPCQPVLKLSFSCRKNKMLGQVVAVTRFSRNMVMGFLVHKEPCRPTLQLSLSGRKKNCGQVQATTRFFRYLKKHFVKPG